MTEKRYCDVCREEVKKYGSSLVVNKAKGEDK